MTPDQMRLVARSLVTRLEAEVKNLKAEEAKEIAACAAHHQPIGEHYWQNRHNAEDRLWAARALLGALE